MSVIANSDLPALPVLWRCNDCALVSEEMALLRAPNPFDTSEEILGCPKCKQVGSFREVCQVGMCESDATCGVPRFRGFRYARICNRHYQEHLRDEEIE